MKMIIEINREEALKFFKRKVRRKVRKFEKMRTKNPLYNKLWQNFCNEIDKLIAGGSLE